MRFFKNRPLLAALIVVGLVGAASGAVYAVNKVFLTFDPSESAPEIEQDLQDQLDKAGVAESSVHAETGSNGTVKVQIMAHDPRLGSADLAIAMPQLPPGAVGTAMQHRTRVETKTDLNDAQQKQLLDAMGDEAFEGQLIQDTHDGKLDTAGEIAAFKAQLAKHGFHDVTIALVGDELQITINAAPN